MSTIQPTYDTIQCPLCSMTLQIRQMVDAHGNPFAYYCPENWSDGRYPIIHKCNSMLVQALFNADMNDELRCKTASGFKTKVKMYWEKHKMVFIMHDF